ncbi:MAG: glycosyltransferase family 39 protein, partial [Anaerolineae bacterium]|nr:glycosyltransferase family 39 protein [Anaerolineae bacterium]
MRALTRHNPQRSQLLFLAALLLVLILGGALRWNRLNWDEYQHAHPDERHITMVATTLRWPDDLSTLLDPKRSTINPFRSPPRDAQSVGEPRAFTYGHFPLYTMTLVAHGLDLISEPPDGGSWADYDHVNLVGRALSGLFDLATVVLIFLLGRRLYDRWVGLLGAALLAFAVTHIQLSHYAAFDAIMATWVVATVYVSVRLADEGRPRDAAAAGICAGLAIGSLVRSAPVLLAPAAAVLYRMVRAYRDTSAQARSSGEGTRWVQWGLLILVLAALTFALTNPYSILEFSAFLRNMKEQSAMVSGEADFPFTRQYRGTIPYVYQIEQQVKWGMGWPLGIFAFAGFAFVIGRALLRRARPGEWVMLAWVVPYFVVNGIFMVKFMRYMIIITPFLILMGAYLLVVATRWLLARLAATRAPAWLAYLLPGGVFLWTFLYAVAFAGIYTREHTWITASRWIYANVPDGSVLAVEHWDDQLPKSLREPGMNPGAHQYRHVTLPLYEEDTPQKYEIIKQALR